MTAVAKLVQIELHVTDMVRSLQFYEEVMGWVPVPAEMHEYVVMAVAEDCPYGIALIPNPKRAPGPGGAVLYFATDDPDALLGRVQNAGGRVLFGPKRLLGYGEIYQFEDPDGQRFGLFRA